MKIAYWVGNHDTTLHILKTDLSWLFEIGISTQIIGKHFCYGYGQFIEKCKYFDNLEKAMRYSSNLAQSAGYRVLTEAEQNLL